MNWRSFWPVLFLIFLFSCNSQQGSVSIDTSGIFAPVLFEINDQNAVGKNLDFGEHLLTDEPQELTIKVNNNSDFPYTDLDLSFSGGQDYSPSISFKADSSGQVQFPGIGGNCTRILKSKTSCTIKAILSPRDERRYQETLTLSFKNYVTPETHVGTIELIAGMPASLAFTNDQTQYTFGQIVGPASTPVVERADTTTYTQELEVVNAGGLPAKNLRITQVETCSSTLTNDCPENMSGAYSIENFCPLRLEPKEKCKLRLHFLPKNQDPESGIVPEDIKEINYRSNVRFAYIKDPRGGNGGLNAYFRSVSTNIEARFKVAIKTLSFDPPIISGNRDTRTFRVNNLGYREGALQSLDIRDSGGILVVSCRATESSPYLTCFNAANNPTHLAEFPFTLKDRNSCLTTPGQDPVYIPVGSGCIFDLIFQPSVTYLQNKETEFLNLQPQIVFDSRWRGLEKIVRSFLFQNGLSAKSRSAARLVMNKLNFNGINYTASGDSPWIVDFGRLTLQSPLFFKRKPMILSFKNEGSVPATNLSFTDASGRTIPLGGTPVNLGMMAPYYFTSVVASESNCTIINPNETCSLTFMFAPIGMDTNAQETANMFDAVDLNLTPYKGIRVQYTSGANFQDSNRYTDIPDYPSLVVESRMKATLVRKGLLMQLADDSRNVSTVGANINVVGDTVISHFYLQNIGTGPVPYFRLMDTPVSGVSLLPTPDPANYGADHDCLALGDEDLTGTLPANTLPTSRTGFFSALPKDETCVYKVQFKASDTVKFHNASSSTCTMGLIPPPSNLDEGTRYFSRDAQTQNSGVDLWEYCNYPFIQWPYITFKYYDGDSSDPSLPPNSTFGNIFTLTDYTVSIQQGRQGKIIPYNFLPWLNATLYRPDFTYPQLSAAKPSLYIPEAWFFGPLIDFFSNPLDPNLTSAFIKGGESKNFVTLLSGYAQRNNYDFIYFMGSFPQNSGAIPLSLGLRNFGGTSVKLLSYSTQPDPAFTVLATPTNLPLNIIPKSDLTPNDFSLNTTTPGEHWLSIEYTIEEGRHIDPLIYVSSGLPKNLNSAGKLQRTQKILVIAQVMDSILHPKISLGVQDFEVIQNDGAPPTTIIGSENLTPLTWNTTTPSSSLIFDTIKLTKAPTTSDPYAMKRLIFRNNSNKNIFNFRVLYRADSTTHMSKLMSSTFTTVNSETTCTSSMNLAIGQSCHITLKYQPGAIESTDNFVATLHYGDGTGRYYMENVGISLLPRSPGFVVAQGITPQNINYKVTPTSSISSRQSYPLNFGTTNLNIVPKTFIFNQSSGSFKKIQLVNTQGTKASLLLSYHRYLSAHSLRGFSPSLIPPTSTIPQASEYRLEGGIEYAPIHRMKYSNNSDRLLIEASKGCLFGDDEISALPHHQKGFNSSSLTPCYLIVTFSANFDYLLKNISVTNGDDMRGTASELWYYSVNRSSTSSLWIHVIGTVNPDISVATTTYNNMRAFENKSVFFNTPKFNPTTASVGNVVGVRVLFSSSSTGLGDPYAPISTYVDIKPYNASIDQLASITTGLANGQFFYFRAVAIRKDSRFVDVAPKKFIGLGAGEYLSLASNLAAPISVLVPPINHYYFHNQRIVVDKGLTGGVKFDTYAQATSTCSTRPRMILKNPGSLSYPYQLISKNAWNLVAPIPSATNYQNADQIFHWLSDPPISIDTTFMGLDGFLPNQASQLLEASSVFYLRNSANPNASVNQAIGGVPGTPNSNYFSLVDGTIPFGSARCMVILP